MKKNNLLTMARAALCLALAYVLPFLTGQIQQIGNMLCPMHLPVLLCGFLCGAPYAAVVGALVPLLRSLTLGMPPLFPTAVCMALELLTYGLLAGLFYRLLPKKKGYIYVALLGAMLGGRVVWGLSMLVAMGLSGGTFTLSAFLAGAFTSALPGILLQLVLIPPLVMILDTKKRTF